MDKDEMLAVYDRDQRKEMRLPGLTYEDTGRIVRDYSLEDVAGYIDYASLDESSADAEIDAQVAFFQARGMPFTWKVFDHDRPADLRQRLAARGFEIEEPDALMMLDLDDAPDFYWSMALTGCVKPVTDLAGIEGIVRLEEEVWQAPRSWLRRHLPFTFENTPERLSLFAVQADGKTVSAGWTAYYPPTQFARLLGGSTLPAYRKRGYYTELLVARVREARQRGCRFITVDASRMSRPILEKHGFQCLEFSSRCHWSPAG